MTPRLLPIIFNQEMTLRILLDDKTETRRVIKPQPLGTPRVFNDPEEGVSILAHVKGRENLYEYFPKYNIGDILYVRETWQEVYELEYDRDAPQGYVNIREWISNFDDLSKVEAGISTNHSSAQMPPRMKYYIFKAGNDFHYTNPDNGLVWRPSIHMPREAARIFLEVTNVYPQKLQEITVDDVLHEGITWIQPPPICQKPITYPESFPRGFDNWDKARQDDWINSTARAEYIGWMEHGRSVLNEWEKLWNSTIPTKQMQIFGYEANPWVWVYKFKRLKERIDLSAFPPIKRR